MLFRQVENPLTRARKEQIVAKLEKAFEGSAVVFGMHYKGLSVKKQEKLRHSLPPNSQMIVCKNSLLRVAIDKQPMWKVTGDIAQGENAWIFVNEEEVASATKAYFAFEKELKEAVPREQRAAYKPCEITGAVLDGKPLDPSRFQSLTKVPTRLELYASIAIAIKLVPTNLAKGIKLVPIKLARGVKQLADGDDNKEAIVSDIFPKPAEASS
eukprot:jgi/Astpho2/5260/Aster-04830